VASARHKATGVEYLKGLAAGGDRFGVERRAYFSQALRAVSGRLSYLFEGRPEEGVSLFDGRTSVTLERISDRNLKRAFLVGLILALRERRKAQRIAFHKDINHFTVIDEAHFVAPAALTNTTGGSETISGEQQLANVVCDGIRELRAYGESMIVADQSPSEVAPALLRNCGAVICHAVQEGNDRSRIRDLLGLDDAQTEALSSLRRQEAVVCVQGEAPYLARIQDLVLRAENS
jgi:DNA helicase HerA-like ATPase